jgi:hypothetical protein
MATILIEHPQHGRMHVYHPDELKRHEAMGWHVVEDKPKAQPNVTPIPQRKARK